MNDKPKEIYMYGHDHLSKVYFCSDKKYDDSEKYIHESEVKELENRLKLYEFIFSINKFDELEKKSKCWDKLKQEANSHFITVGEMTDIEQEVEADESKPQI